VRQGLDWATIGGLVLGWGLVGWAISSQPGGLFFLDFASLAIVLGGSVGAVLINLPLERLRAFNAALLKVLFHREERMEDSIRELVSFAERTRREGILALEQSVDKVKDPFLREGIRLAVDGTEPETIRAILEIELRSMEERHQESAYLWSQFANYAPAFGMIGTLIGLIQMLQSLDDPSRIGAGMATALVTTFYGAMLANLLALPVAGKLMLRSRQESGRRAMVIEAILSIQNGDNPRILEEKLRTFLPPRQRGLRLRD
jgi:chemotaxis protein MotA